MLNYECSLVLPTKETSRLAKQYIQGLPIDTPGKLSIATAFFTLATGPWTEYHYFNYNLYRPALFISSFDSEKWLRISSRNS